MSDIAAETAVKTVLSIRRDQIVGANAGRESAWKEQDGTLQTGQASSLYLMGRLVLAICMDRASWVVVNGPALNS